MKTIPFSLFTALSLGTAIVPSLAQAQSFGRDRREARHGMHAPVAAPAVVVAPPVVVPVARPTIALRANFIPRPVYAQPPRQVGYGVYGNSTLGDGREMRQEQRIRIAAMRGQLTPREYDRLMRGQADIDALQARAASDGVVTPFETREIERA